MLLPFERAQALQPPLWPARADGTPLVGCRLRAAPCLQHASTARVLCCAGGARKSGLPAPTGSQNRRPAMHADARGENAWPNARRVGQARGGSHERAESNDLGRPLGGSPVGSTRRMEKGLPCGKESHWLFCEVASRPGVARSHMSVARPLEMSHDADSGEGRAGN